MFNFAHRSYTLELLDQPNISAADIYTNMHELNIINTWLGGHATTIKGFASLSKNQTQLSVCEIGCGGGDNINAIYAYCQKHNINATFTGIDYNEHCIEFAKKKYSHLPAQWICADAFAADTQAYDIIFTSLFCHHFKENDVQRLAVLMQRKSRLGYFINDLQRNRIAYASIKILTSLFSKSHLVKNDAPLSVQRGFLRSELQHLFSGAKVMWCWAFRYLVVFKQA
jgi:2-polyprenyl-3-methyl-5-hydroxy-6-metoxy-1,4-benzoquinol methylase